MFSAISECASLPWTTGGKHIFLPPQYFNLNWLSLSTFLFIFNNPHHKPTGVINSQCHLPLPNTWMQRVLFRFLILWQSPLLCQVKVDPCLPKVLWVVSLETKYYNYCKWKDNWHFVRTLCAIVVLFVDPRNIFNLSTAGSVTCFRKCCSSFSHSSSAKPLQRIINYVFQYVLLFSVKSHLSVSHHSAAEFE